MQLSLFDAPDASARGTEPSAPTPGPAPAVSDTPAADPNTAIVSELVTVRDRIRRLGQKTRLAPADRRSLERLQSTEAALEALSGARVSGPLARIRKSSQVEMLLTCASIPEPALSVEHLAHVTEWLDRQIATATRLGHRDSATLGYERDRDWLAAKTSSGQALFWGEECERLDRLLTFMGYTFAPNGPEKAAIAPYKRCLALGVATHDEYEAARAALLGLLGDAPPPEGPPSAAATEDPVAARMLEVSAAEPGHRTLVVTAPGSVPPTLFDRILVTREGDPADVVEALRRFRPALARGGVLVVRVPASALTSPEEDAVRMRGALAASRAVLRRLGAAATGDRAAVVSAP